jgi:glycosyltransferase involved in cell wall biosynthesis
VGLDGTDGAISFVFDTDASVANLLGSVDFFLCCDAVGGLSLSLVEAMMAGVPLLTTMTSATGSFLIQGCAVPIPTVTVVADEIDDPMARFMKLGCDVPTASGIRDAILAAVDLDDATCTTMTTACRQIADRNFGIAAFRAGLVRIEEFLGQRDR